MHSKLANIFTETTALQNPVISNLPQTWLERQMVPPPTVKGINELRRKRVAVYLRYSTDHQDPFSFERQLARAREYCEQNGYEIVAVYSDAGESGGFTANRMGYQDMMAAGERHEFEALVVEEGDRLSRKLHITANTYNALRDLGIELHSSKVGVWSLLHVAFQGLMSEEQRIRITDLMRSGRVKIVGRGLWPGRVPFGYEKIAGVAGDMIVHEKRAETVKRIYSMRRKGLTHGQIARILHVDGIELPGGTKWNALKVAYILHNPIYTGLVFYFKSKVTKRETKDGVIELIRVMLPTAEWKFSERSDWAMIKMTDWQAVQEMDKGKKEPGSHSTFLLSRKVYCASCGHRAHATSKTRSGRFWMRCNAKWKIKNLNHECAPCDERGVMLDSLEDAVIRVVCDHLDAPEALNNMRSAYERAAKARFDELNRDRMKLVNERAKISARLDATYDAAMVAGLTTTVVREQRIGLCNRIEAIDGKLASLPLIAMDHTSLFSAPLDAASFLSELSPMRNYRDCDEALANLRSIFRRLVEKVMISTDKETGRVLVRIEGPIAHVEGNDSIDLKIEHETQNGAILRFARIDARRGRYSITDADWEKIKDLLPSDPVWSEEYDEPLPFRRVMEALIFLKSARVGPGNLDDTFGPKRQVWSALRMMNYAGILDLAQNVMDEAGIASAKGLKFGFDTARTTKANPLDRYVEGNNRRKARVLARLAQTHAQAAE
jgi:site-specific DNA recombinase